MRSLHPSRPGSCVHGALMVVALMFAAPAFAQLSPGELVDIAGRQRMLSQRIIKAYAQAAQYVHKQPSEDQLKASIVLFEKQMRTLQQYTANDQVRAALVQVESLWKPFSATAGGVMDRDGATQLMLASETLLQACQTVVTGMESAYGVSNTRLVNLSGRQRMLSQRITKAYMLLNWGFRDEALSRELEQARGEFESALEELRKAPENTAEINEALVEVGREWAVFRKAFLLREKGEYVPFFIAVAGDHILTTMDGVTGMYARLGKPSP